MSEIKKLCENSSRPIFDYLDDNCDIKSCEKQEMKLEVKLEGELRENIKTEAKIEFKDIFTLQ